MFGTYSLRVAVLSVIASFGITSASYASGEMATSARRSSISPTLDRIEFFLRNTQLGSYAGSERILASEITVTSDKNMRVSTFLFGPFTTMPTALQSQLPTVSSTTTVADDIFGLGTSFTFGGGVTPRKIEYVGFDSTLPKGAIATSAANGGLGAGLITVVVDANATVSLSGKAGNEFYQSSGSVLEAGQIPFPTIVSAVPEPATFAAFGLGTLLVLRRR